MWGNLTTDMFQTYAHLTGTDIDTEILSTYEISVEQQTKAHTRLEPRQCEQCKTINSPNLELLPSLQAPARRSGCGIIRGCEAVVHGSSGRGPALFRDACEKVSLIFTRHHRFSNIKFRQYSGMTEGV